MSDEKNGRWIKIKTFLKIMAGAIIISLGFSFSADSYVLNPYGGIGRFSNPFEVGLGIFLLLIGGAIFIKSIKDYL